MAMLKRLHLSWISTRFISPIIVAGVTWFSAGCATHQMYHPDLNPGTPDKNFSSAVWKDDRGPYFGIVEFDDQGERWDSSVPAASKPGEYPTTQLQAVTRAIKQAAGNGEKPFYLIIFAHGWNNDASKANFDDKEKNLFKFHQAITGLRDLHKADGVAVFGVYLAWRGKASAFPLNFYDRNEGGRRVGERATGTVFELITAGRQASPNSKIALIGHSFGCHLIESAVTPALQADVARSPLPPHNGVVKPVADLVLLINPATSSLYTKPLVDQLRDTSIRFAGEKHRVPLMITVTSEGDSATGTWFPFGYKAGRRISVFNTSVAGQYRKNPPAPSITRKDPEDQSFNQQHTAGWNPGLYSHFICKEPFKEGQRAPKDLNEKVRSNYLPWTDEGEILIHGTKQNYRILPMNQPYNNTPYWIMQLPEDIIPDHTTIWGDEVICLVTGLLYLPNQHKQQPDDPVRNLPPRETAPDFFRQHFSAQRLK